MTYDLHIHSCLSPCAGDDMTPANIVGFAKLNGIDLIAVTDHNAADNLPAVAACCAAYGVQLLPGIEVSTEEDIHLLTYFKNVETALEMGRHLYEALPAMPYDKEIWGRQLVMDENDEILAEREKLLTSPSALNLYDAVALCERLGGIAIPAHIDKDSTSLLSVLGFAPDDINFAAFEVKRPEHTLARLEENGRIPAGREILSSSDAHQLCDIAEYPRTLAAESILQRLL